MNKCISVTVHFDGHADAWVQCCSYCLMQHVHWMPPLGNYSLCIAPAAARATANNTTMKKWTNFAGHFDGRSGAPVDTARIAR
jgi:hypothetical protein